VRDVREDNIDRAIAGHVINLHMQRLEVHAEGDFSLDDIKKFITYAKMKC
jgi:DNA replicative helicase MCM subunit Mcm2 (Cdc46/Mcm family)